ncbi:unnamed protein product [Cercospora beticola]|nr:unnamed protein product [Cercospora beticola]
MAGYLDSVTIIGAGLGGCALGLALSARDIPVTIYESRPEVSGVIPSGVILTPNGLRILDRLGVYERIKDRCYVTTDRIFLNDAGEITKKVPLGGPEVNGYWNHRIWRGLLLDEMRLMLKERNVPIHYNSKFNGIVSEDPSTGVTFLINNTPHQTSLLIGSDGIYSTLRTHLSPTTQPTYTGLLGILAHIPWSSVSWPSPDFPRNATLQGKPASIFWIAEDPPSTHPSPQIMIGLQTQHSQEYSRTDLESLQNDKSRLLEFYKKSYSEHGPLARSIIDAIEQYKETLYIWPFMKMPKMSTWYSTKCSGRIILVGDGAHALPPSSGQGVNQALEDVYSLVLVLEEASKGGNGKEESILEALEFWQKIRQDRIDAIYDWTMNTNNVNRLPEAEREKLMKEGKMRVGEGDDTRWLFGYDYDEVVKDWIEKRKEKNR